MSPVHCIMSIFYSISTLLCYNIGIYKMIATLKPGYRVGMFSFLLVSDLEAVQEGVSPWLAWTALGQRTLLVSAGRALTLTCVSSCNTTLHVTTEHCDTLNYIALQSIALHNTSLHSTVPHCTVLCCTALNYNTHTIQCIILHYTALHYIVDTGVSGDAADTASPV